MERKEDLVENLMSSTGCRTSEETGEKIWGEEWAGNEPHEDRVRTYAKAYLFLGLLQSSNNVQVLNGLRAS